MHTYKELTFFIKSLMKTWNNGKPIVLKAIAYY